MSSSPPSERQADPLSVSKSHGTLMWKCQKCGESIEETFHSCWKCGAPDDGTSPRFSPSPVQLAVSPSPGSSAKVLHILVGLFAAALCVSFFLPWIQLLGAGLSGLDIQKLFESYRLVWMMPVLAVVVLVLNLAGLNTSVIRRIAGLCPFAILIYAITRLGGDLFQAIQFGGWLTLIAGAALILIPSEPKTPA